MTFRLGCHWESSEENSQFSHDVTAVMLMYRTIAEKIFWDFDSIFVQNLSDILPLFCTPTWPSYHLSEYQELIVMSYQSQSVHSCFVISN